MNRLWEALADAVCLNSVGIDAEIATQTALELNDPNLVTATELPNLN